MTTDRKAGVALVAGALAGLLTMALHPTGAAVRAEAARGGTYALTTAVHLLGIGTQPLLLLGMLVLTRRLRAHRDLAVSALVVYAFAAVALLCAATASGLIAPAVLARDASPDALRFTWHLNQAFATIGTAFAAVAIGLWSAAMVRERFSAPLGAYGLALAVVVLLGLGSGHLRLDVHGFGAVVLGQAVWLIGTGVRLGRAPRHAPAA